MANLHVIGLVFSAFLLCTFNAPVPAQDSLDQILSQLHISQTSEYNYTESRELQLMHSPRQASGELYISAQQMIIVQHLPKQIYILITAEKMHYLDTRQSIHYVKKLKKPFEIPQMGAFLSLLYGQHSRSSLNKLYKTDLSSDSSGWKLKLTAKNDHPVEIMELLGENGLAASQLKLFLKDGDKTTWNFSLVTQGKTVDNKMDLIVKKIREYKNTNETGSANR